MNEFEGVYVVLVTPLDASGAFDGPGLRKNIDWLISEGVDGLVVMGSTGEFASFGDAERRAIVDATANAVAERIPLLVGVGAETTEKTISNIREAERCGADGTLVLPPWYYTPSAEELIQHYTAIGAESRIPLMIYNNPFTSKVDVTPDVVRRIANEENIVAIKESSGNIRRIAEIRLCTDDRLSVFCGWEDMAYESFLVGAKGWICVAGNVVPQLSRDLYRLTRAGETVGDAWSLYARMLPLLRYFEYRGKTQVALKWMLDQMGLAGGRSTSPKLPLPDSETSELREIMKSLGISSIK